MTVLTETVFVGDCRDIMPKYGPSDMILADLPDGDTSLAWYRRVDGWIALARAVLRPTCSLRGFGSLRHFMATADRLAGCRHLGCEIDADMAEKARARITAVLSFSGRASP
ncbi:hypothetical protein [Agrobacterium tumefaciens]|uniref:hypothetical protein n=1 Tax=Agrobacterium tumefaciens TaxID=358 RepID=UPI003C6C5922